MKTDLELRIENNKLANMLSLDLCRKYIADCPKDETVILIPHYSINKPDYNSIERDEDRENEEFFELGEYLNCSLCVSDYDDLIADPHGLYSY